MASSQGLKKQIIGVECLKMLVSIAASGVIAHEIVVGTNLSKLATVYVTLMGFIMLQIVVIMSELLKSPLHRAVLVTVNIAGCLMYTASSAVMLSFLFSFSDWNYLPGGDRLLAAGILAACNAALSLVTLGMAAKR